MGRILSFDYGTVRLGIAVSDITRTFAFPLTTIHPKDILTWIKTYDYFTEVDCFLIGLPKNLQNEIGKHELNIQQFINVLKKHFPNIIIERWDERFTSKIAMHSMIEQGFNKKQRQNKSNLDVISACIILQDYLAFNNKI